MLDIRFPLEHALAWWRILRRLAICLPPLRVRLRRGHLTCTAHASEAGFRSYRAREKVKPNANAFHFTPGPASAVRT